MVEFSYQSDAIDSATKSGPPVELTTRQRELIQGLGAVVGPVIGMPELACRGFWVLAVSDWQQATRRKIGEIEKVPPEQRLMVVKEIAALFTKRVVKSLSNPDKEQFLQRAIGEGMQLYLLRFWKRER